MKIKQEIPWYKNDYMKEKWLERKSSHYVFYYFNLLYGGLYEKDVEKIVELKENHYNKILSFLGLENTQIIHYYIYPTLKDKIALMGDDSPGNAIWEEFELLGDEVKTSKFEIHIVYGDERKFIGEHEDVHLLSLPLGLSIYLFCEGLAQFMEGNIFGKDIDVVARELLNQNRLYSIKDLADNSKWEKTDPEIIYAEAGSFARFLINTYGWNKYKEVYRKLSRLNNFAENLIIINLGFEKSIEKLEDDWKNYLKERAGF